MKSLLLSLLFAGSVFAKPNFVFILVDDMSWVGTSVEMIAGDDETKSDYYQTPNIEKLAEQGMLFSQAYSPGPLCTPSRAGILTGKTPGELHITTPGRGGRPEDYQKLLSPRVVTDLPESETTIAEALKKQGYATAHLGKWHLGRVSPGEHGFDVHDGATENEEGDAGENPKDIFGVTERAVEFMKDNRDKPFYLQLSHYAVHSPFQCLEESLEKFSRVRKGERHSDETMAAMTWDLDVSIGTLLDEIDKLGLAENTYVIFMSDNGGPASPRRSQNRPMKGGKGTLYEGGIRVPLIVRGPGIESGSSCGEAVTGCDLFPTFCELAGIPAEVDGASLVPLLRQTDEFQRQNPLVFHYPHYGHGPSQTPQSAIISNDWKLIKNLESGEVELFNLTDDWKESRELSGKYPEKAEELEDLLDQRLDELGVQMPTENPDYDPTARPERGRRR